MFRNGKTGYEETTYDSGKIVLTKVSDLVIFVNRMKLILGLTET